MNERLKELMLEAGYAAPEMAGRANKLAELIVRECADIATINSHQWHSAGRFVLTHFGVELDVNETLRNRSTYFGNDI